MISPSFATCIVITFILVFGVVVPILNRRAPKYISYRWCVVVVLLALLIGAVVDFGELNDTARQAVIIGALIVAGVYVILRTLEKALANGWLQHTQIEAKKGDISVKISNSEKGGENGP